MVESTHPLRCSFVKGRSLPLGKGASAKALLAFMNPARQAAALNRLSDENVLSPDARNAFEHQLEQIRTPGYATSNSEVDAGIWGISAPIYTHQDTPTAAVITLLAPTTRATNTQ